VTHVLLNIALVLALASLIYVVLTGWFFAYTKAYELKEQGVEFDWVVKYPIYVFLVIGLVCDIIFNIVWGSIIFVEPPKELTFSQRVSRHFRQGHPVAIAWENRINKIFPGHIK